MAPIGSGQIVCVDSLDGTTQERPLDRGNRNMKTRLLLISLLCAGRLFGQQSVSALAQPDCSYSFRFATPLTAPSDGINFDNRSGYLYELDHCLFKLRLFGYFSIGSWGAVNNAGAPGSWGSFQSQVNGALVSGANPNTTITQAISTFTGPIPWVSVELTTFTGTGVVTGYCMGEERRELNRDPRWRERGRLYSSVRL